MITNETMLTPIQYRGSAFQAAIKMYADWKGQCSFWDDLLEYHMKGFVVCRPTIFALFKIILLKDEPAWFVRAAIGDFGELLEAMPKQLPWIAFCRHNQSRIRRYPTRRLLHLFNLDLTQKLRRK